MVAAAYLFPKTCLYGGNKLLAEFKFQSVSGLYKNFTKMSPTDIEYLIDLMGF